MTLPDSKKEELSIQYQRYIEKLKTTFTDEFKQLCALDPIKTNFKKQIIPIARVKKVMKTDEDVNVI